MKGNRKSLEREMENVELCQHRTNSGNPINIIKAVTCTCGYARMIVTSVVPAACISTLRGFINILSDPVVCMRCMAIAHTAL